MLVWVVALCCYDSMATRTWLRQSCQSGPSPFRHLAMATRGLSTPKKPTISFVFERLASCSMETADGQRTPSALQSCFSSRKIKLKQLQAERTRARTIPKIPKPKPKQCAWTSGTGGLARSLASFSLSMCFSKTTHDFRLRGKFHLRL